MVSPIVILAALLGFAFIYPLIEKLGQRLGKILSVLGLVAITVLSFLWIPSIWSSGKEITANTAGFPAPLSINLKIDFIAALVIFSVNLIATLILAYQTFRSERSWKGKQIVLFLLLLLGANGLIMTQDLFNIFVFMEIASISLFGLLSTSKDKRSHEAGFKYMVAGGLASALFLIGLAILYIGTGSLNLVNLFEATGSLSGFPGILASILLLSGILIELKPFLANGWALDTYETADGALGSAMSGILATAMIMVLFKVYPIFQNLVPNIEIILMVLGSLSFLGSQIVALKQRSIKRILGISSTAQIGLIILVLGLVSYLMKQPGNQQFFEISLLTFGLDSTHILADVLKGMPLIVAILLLLNHSFAKSVLFLIVSMKDGAHKEGTLKNNAQENGGQNKSSFRKRLVLLVSSGVSILALLGLPPFPSFFAKWILIQVLGNEAMFILLAIILLGSLLEAWYLFRWYFDELKTEVDTGSVTNELVPDDSVPMDYSASASILEAKPEERAVFSLMDLIPGIFTTLLMGAGLALTFLLNINFWVISPVLALLGFALFDTFHLPSKVKLIIALAALGYFAWTVIPGLEGLHLLFSIVFVGGAAIQLLAFFDRKGRNTGLVGPIVAMVLSLSALLISKTNMELFFSWEMMTISSLILVLRGKKSSAAGLRYAVFSLLSAFLLLAGMSLMTPGLSISNLGLEAGGNAVATMSPILGILFALALIIKLGVLGVHIWLPSSYAEAEDDVTSLLSSVLSKAGLFILFSGFLAFLSPFFTLFSGTNLEVTVTAAEILGWLGVITALGGSLMAVFQEDIKYTLAYSSMGQIGYMIASYSLMSHLGWLASLYLLITHVLIKGMLFLAVTGVIKRVQTRLMYQMGGLIKNMPISFLSVLIAIIALSGVPPLTGFGGKWMLYTALLEKGWYLQAGIAMFASAVAFLYLYRLIHSIFLGQRKDIHANIKEAPMWVLIPQIIFMLGVMFISMYPSLLLQPLQGMVGSYFGSTVDWNGYDAISTLGNWNGNAIMYVTMGVFGVALLWLLLMNLKKDVKSVKQFNIVFAAERPYRPETTHFAYNFFAHYRKALGFAAQPWAEKIWQGVSSVSNTFSGFLRRWNTGNAQTYGFQVLLYLLLVFVLVIAQVQGGIQ